MGLTGINNNSIEVNKTLKDIRYWDKDSLINKDKMFQ